MEEIFKPVKGFEHRYEISNHGRLISINGRHKGRKMLKGCIDFAGYVAIMLRKDGTVRHSTRMHVIVAETFLEKPDRATCVNHIDGNKSNNIVTNLEWVTFLENSQHAVKTGLFDIAGEKHPFAKLTDVDVLAIRKLCHTTKHKEIGEIYGISRRHICDIVNGVVWAHLPLEDYSKRVLKRSREHTRTITNEMLEKVHQLRKKGLTFQRIANDLGIKMGGLYGAYRKRFIPA